MAAKVPTDPDKPLGSYSVPPGRMLRAAGLDLLVRELPGPPPPVVLLHGLGATAAFNWFGAFGPVGARHQVLSIDLPGHGRSAPVPNDEPMNRIADAVAEVIDLTCAREAVVVGYSLGGAIAQLLWHRHQESVRSIVLAATARDFTGQPIDRLRFWAASNPVVRLASRVFPPMLRLPMQAVPWIDSALVEWVRAEFGPTSSRSVIRVAEDLGQFTSREWIGEVDVPTSIVVTTRDRLVPPGRQLRLAQALQSPTLRVLPETHLAPFTNPDVFGAAIGEAVDTVATPKSPRRPQFDRSFSLADGIKVAPMPTNGSAGPAYAKCRIPGDPVS